MPPLNISGGEGPPLSRRRIMMISGEASGDLHGGALSSALLAKDPSLQIVGIGGPAMKKAGVDIRFDIAQLGIVGIFEVLAKLRSIWQAYQVAKSMLAEGVNLLVLIDFPDFNLMVAKVAKRIGVPVVYYISPQLWAWRSGRIQTIRERVDKMLVILPFEEKLYRDADIPCEFVGHPLLDEAAPILAAPFSKSGYLRAKGLDPSRLTIGLLPGSRSSEIETHLPIMLKGIEQLAGTIAPFQVLIPVASTVSIDQIQNHIRSSPLTIRLIEREIYSVLRAMDAAVVVSGTVTLQAALSQTPMIVIYKISALTYALVRQMIPLKYVSLVNIVAQTGVVPELIQHDVTPDRIAKEMRYLLTDKTASDQMKAGLNKVATSLGKRGASDRAADAIYAMLQA